MTKIEQEKIDLFFDEIGFGALIGIVLLVLGIWLTIYLFTSYATWRAAKASGYDKPWLAWLPAGNQFVIILIAKDYANKKIKNLLLPGFFISLLLGLVFDNSIIVNLTSVISLVIVLYSFYIIAKWFSDNYVSHVVIAAITLSFSVPFSLLMFRNRTPYKGNDKKKEDEGIVVPKENYKNDVSKSTSNSNKTNETQDTVSMMNLNNSQMMYDFTGSESSKKTLDNHNSHDSTYSSGGKSSHSDYSSHDGSSDSSSSHSSSSYSSSSYSSSDSSSSSSSSSDSSSSSSSSSSD